MKSDSNKKKAQGPPEEAGEKAPLWIISFADMISLLMAFFVMLLTMANTKSGKLCNPGEGVFERTIFGFRSSISGLGMPELFGKASESDSFEFGKSHYNLAGDINDDTKRIIDSREEKVRRLFGQIKKGMKTYSRPQTDKTADFAITPIVFEKGQYLIDDAGKQFLKQFVLNLEESGNTQIGLYVIGTTPEKLPEQQKWLLSVRRAQAAGDFLQSIMPASHSTPVYCWGWGDDSQVTDTEAAGANQPEILIAVLGR
jgi:hypothetical protein